MNRSGTAIQVVDLDEDFTDPQIVADHVRDLVAAAWTRQQIARISDVDLATVRALLGESTIAPQPKRLHARTGQQLLAIGADRLTGLPDHAIVDSTGTHRRVRAMAAMGYPVADTLREISAQSAMMHRPTVTAGTARKTIKLYRERSYVPGPSPRAAQIARSKGWPPPAAWNNDIDDPRATPCGIRKL